MSNTVKILFLGATGYIGGTVLDRLLKHSRANQFDITVFVHSAEKAKKCESVGLKALSGDLSALENAVSAVDVVFNAASSVDPTVTQAVLAGAKKHYTDTNVPPVLIHTSGTAIVADQAMGQYASEKVYDDADSAAIDALPVGQFHRSLDILIVDAHKEGYVKAYIVAPPYVWGLATGKLVDDGLQNPIPTGLLVIARLGIARGTFGVVGPALNIWSGIEVNDLAGLYLTIFNASVVDGKDIAGGSAYYFAANGDLITKVWMTKVAHALYNHGALESPDVTQFTPDELQKWPIAAAYSINSRVSDSRARSLGWKPVHHTSEHLDEVDKEIALMVTQSDDFGASWATFGQ